MKPILELLPRDSDESFFVDHKDFKYYPTPWHFHPEYELVLITKSIGKRFVGDSIANFAPGSLAFLGSNLPHTYKNDEAYYLPGSALRAASIVVQFQEGSLGNDFLALPETRAIKQLFEKSKKGLDILGNTNKIVTGKIWELTGLKGLPKWLKLIEILHLLAETKEYKTISGGCITGTNEKESGRMDEVLKFIIGNFGEEITLSDAAKIANMADNSFSRFFKQRTRKTFTSYLNEWRIHHAARLLIENNKAITDICYDCGFNNLSNFHRHFKKAYHSSPLAYRKTYWEKAT